MSAPGEAAGRAEARRARRRAIPASPTLDLGPASGSKEADG